MAKRKKNAEHSYDVLIIGAGIMGCASAWQLARLGLKVLVLEKSVPGAEASSAAAGILGAQAEAHAAGPMSELCARSARLYPAFAAALVKESAIDVEHRACGALRVAFDSKALRSLEKSNGFQKRRTRLLAAEALRKLEPKLGPKVKGGIVYPLDGRVDPKRLLRALHIAATHAGAEFRSGAYVRRVSVDGERAHGVALDDGKKLTAQWVVVAAGSWTTLVEGTGLGAQSVVPARGQIVELEASAPVVKSVVFGPGAYLVPRDDGRVLVGSTLEFVGYRREVTAGAVQALLTAALELVPALAEAKLVDAWSNFRPYTQDELPLLGPTRIQGLLLATGHYRNGILLAPVTAEIVSSLVMGKRAPFDLAPFDPSRFPLLPSP